MVRVRVRFKDRGTGLRLELSLARQAHGQGQGYLKQAAEEELAEVLDVAGTLQYGSLAHKVLPAENGGEEDNRWHRPRDRYHDNDFVGRSPVAIFGGNSHAAKAVHRYAEYLQ